MNEVIDFIKNFCNASDKEHKEIQDFLSKKSDIISSNVSPLPSPPFIANLNYPIDQVVGPLEALPGPLPLALCPALEQAGPVQDVAEQGRPRPAPSRPRHLRALPLQLQPRTR